MKKKPLRDGGQPLVSVLIPIYNVEKYLDQCLASLAAQTIKDAEFICINDGSTDGCLAIIQSYMKRDKRFKLLDKANSGYGDSMNQGLKKAEGKYIGIVESDDWAEPTMFAELTKLAEDNQAQAVKSNFYFYVSRSGGSNTKCNLMDPSEVGTIVVPRQTPYIFNCMASIWSGLYLKQFLVDNKINFLPTPGASYQDTGFNFKVWTMADRAIYTTKAYLHYRIDNETSSVKSRAKVFCVCDEFDSIKQYLIDNGRMDQLKSVYTWRKYDIYHWNQSRLDGQNLRDFTERMAEEFKQDQSDGYFDLIDFSDQHKEDLKKIIESPGRYLRRRAIRQAIGKICRRMGQTLSHLSRSYIKRQEVIYKLAGSIKLNDDSISHYQAEVVDQPTKYAELSVAGQPLISVIIPVYNAEQYLAETIDSLINQTLANIEIICIDDGSTDGSLALLKKYAKQDKRIKVYHQKNAGVATARNEGLRRANGKYIMWCDSDDTYTPNMCLKMFNIMERRQVDLAICSQNVILNQLERKLRRNTKSYLEQKYNDSQLINWQLIVNTDVSLWNKIFRKDIIDRYDIKFPDGLLFEDAYFCNCYMLRCQTIFFSKDKLYNYIRRPSSIMSTSFRKHKSSADYLKITESIFRYLKEQGMYSQYADFFWLRLIQDYSYAHDNQTCKGKLETQLSVREFIDQNYDDFQQADPGIQRAVWRTLKILPILKLREQTKNLLKRIWFKLSKRYRQHIDMLKLSNQVAGQADYLEYLTKNRNV